MSKGIFWAAIFAVILLPFVAGGRAPLAAPPPPPAADFSASPSSVDFGSLTPDAAAVSNTLTITNTGNAPVVVNSSLATSSADEFAKQNDACFGVDLPAGDTCTLDIVFTPAPGGHGIKNAILNATAYPGEAAVSVDIVGTVNNPPLAATLVYPADGATGIPETFTFIWNNASDPDGDTVTYVLLYGTSSTLTGSPPISTGKGGGYDPIVAGSSMALMLLTVVMAGGIGGRRKALIIVIVMALSSFVLLSCGGTEGTVAVVITDDTAPPAPGENQTGHQAEGLSTVTTYYWKVVAVDSLGGTAESPTWSFTTR